MDKNIYVVIGKYGVDCFSNLTKLIKAYPVFNYFHLYYNFKRTQEIKIKDYSIWKLTIK